MMTQIELNALHALTTLPQILEALRDIAASLKTIVDAISKEEKP